MIQVKNLWRNGAHHNIFEECGNPMTSKIVDWKIQTNLTHVKTIQYDAVGGILDCFYTCEEAWIFNPLILKSLDYHSSMVE